jgi:hypothetical protein
VHDSVACLALAKDASCFVSQNKTDDEHRRQANFDKRRELMLVWKKTHLAIVNKDVVRVIDAMILKPFF